MPPIAGSKRFVCQKADLHSGYVSQGQRQTHVLEDCNCSFQCTIRYFEEVENLAVLLFVKGEHIHTCSTQRDHFLPLRPSELLFILKGLAQSGAVQEFYRQEFVPQLKARMEKGERKTKFDTMTEADLSKLARSLGVGTQPPRSGEEDLRQAREILAQLQRDGATVAYKPPGLSVDHPQAILAERAKPFLRREDSFIFVTTKFQSKLLASFGRMVATDGTHAIFSYGSMKVIAVMVTSYVPDNENVKERGFPVALAIVNSEREDIHKAIVAHLLTAVPTWEPELLMTDMAFSAFHAWSTYFSGLFWLWCVFHVWQAWIKRLGQMPNSSGMDKDSWEHLKGILIAEIKELISPKDRQMSNDEFDERAAKFRMFSGSFNRQRLPKVGTCTGPGKIDGQCQSDKKLSYPCLVKVQRCQCSPGATTSARRFSAY